jgi:tetratricopeptide (TPR) repeat protein
MEREPDDVTEPAAPPTAPAQASPARSSRRRLLVPAIAIVAGSAAVVLAVVLVVARPFAPRGLPGSAASEGSAAGAQLAAGAEGPRPRGADPMTQGLDALYKRHEPALAVARFREVLAQNPEHYGATFQLATALEQAGKPAEARLVWEKMLGMAEATGDAATLEQARARLAELRKLAPPSAELNPDPDAEGMRLGLDALYTQHDPPGAVIQFRKVLAHNPEHYGATFQLATALDRAGRPAEARPLWIKVLKMADAIKDTSSATTARTRLAMNP